MVPLSDEHISKNPDLVVTYHYTLVLRPSVDVVPQANPNSH